MKRLVFALTLLSAAIPAFAQECSRDLSALSAQVSDAKAKGALTQSIDQRIQELGGVDAAIEKVQASLATLRQALTAGSPLEQALAHEKDAGKAAARRRAYQEGIKVNEAFLAALQCRKAQAASQDVATQESDTAK